MKQTDNTKVRERINELVKRIHARNQQTDTVKQNEAICITSAQDYHQATINFTVGHLTAKTA